MMAAILVITASMVPGPAKAYDYLTTRKWLQAVDDAVAGNITYEICGWGFIDLLTPLLTAGQRHGFRPLALDELAKRYDDESRERRRTEAVLTAHGANAPTQRVTGLYATGGCSDSIRERIERRMVEPLPIPMGN
jgi:hypothetical protein